MRNRVERLRIWLLAGALVLLMVLAAFIGYARYLKHGFLARLPSKLGVGIVRETNGFTYSQSVQGKTIYTIHAAKAIEHTDGKITLHDVGIVIYGQKQDRTDHIYGDQFEYDQKAGLIRAMGLVHIDMQAAPAAAAGTAKAAEPVAREAPLGADDPAAHDPKVLHATTSGLVYSQNLAVAATNEYIEFQMGGMTGHATGADYNTDSGLLMLHSKVLLSGISNGRPFVLDSASAQLDPRSHVDQLAQAKYVSLEQKVDAEHATVYTREDGSPQRVLAEGNVSSEVNGATLTAQQADVELNEAGQPQSAVLEGGVTYASDDPLRQARGEARRATVAFDAHGQPQHAVFEAGAGGTVHLLERVRASEEEREPWSVRDLTAVTVNASLVAVAPGRTELRDAEGVGSAHLTIVNNGSLKAAGGQGRSDLAADDLKAHFVESAAAPGPSGKRSQQPQLDSLVGRGHTSLKQVAVDGTEQTSTGDTLDAKLRPPVAGAAGAAGANRQLADAIERAVQQGHVTMARHVPQHGSKAALDEYAKGERAVYDGDTDHLTLTGGVQLSEPGGVLWANQVVFDHDSGDATAVGAVRVIYQQPPQPASAQPRAPGAGQPGASANASAQEPVHVLADHAELNNDAGVAIFYGAGSARPARMWQGGSQVEAPVIELEQEQRRMIAHGDSGAVDAVHTVLVSQTAGTAKPGAARTQVVRIASRTLNYSDESRQAEFAGGVKVESADGTMLAQQATVYLQQPDAAGKPGATKGGVAGASAAGAPPKGQAMMPAGRIERVVATGNIQIDQPGRQATGERLVYTASDGLYVLTGDGKSLPKVVDAQRGMSTGASLGFHSGDESVTILAEAPGGVPSAAAGRVHTEAAVKSNPKVKE